MSATPTPLTMPATAGTSPNLTTPTSMGTQRQSLLLNRSGFLHSPSPSAASFHTAPLIASPSPAPSAALRPRHTSLTPSFVSTVSPTIRDSTTSSELNANAIHAITATATVQEAHIVRLTGETTIHYDSVPFIKSSPTTMHQHSGGTSPILNEDSLSGPAATTTITAHISGGDSASINILSDSLPLSGPPPPSPPASEADLEFDTRNGSSDAETTTTVLRRPALVSASSSPAVLRGMPASKNIPTHTQSSPHQAPAPTPNVIPTTLQSLPSPPPTAPQIDTNMMSIPGVQALTASPGTQHAIFDEPEAMSDHGSSSHTHRTAPSHFQQPSGSHQPRYSSSSTSSHGQPQSILQVPTPRTPSVRLAAPEPMPSKQPVSADGYLQPPARPIRRNTTGSSTRQATSHHHGPRFIGGMLGGRSSLKHFALDDAELAAGTVVTGELATDIELAAEQIRRERMEKRAQAEAEAAAFKDQEQQYLQMKKKDHKVAIGNVIDEGHVNYVLMYNMLTGIRVGVSRCQAKIRRDLTEEDFHARHKFSFDIIGNELTPSAKYDFKFKDYAPWVFRLLREDHFHLDPADYLLSLTEKYILSELGSPGKSGSFFYFSRDYRFIIKTIRHAEHKFLFSILPKYYEHVKANPHTLLSRFYGLHRVKLPRGRKIHFVIMNNLFPPHKDIHETFDLKGSTVGREYPEEKARMLDGKGVVLKDLNFINRGKMLELGPEKRALLTEQLRRDAEFLKEINVMDYSLLVGIHNMQRGNRDNVRKNTLKVFQPNIPPTRVPTLQGHKAVGAKSPEAIAMRRAMRSSDLKRLGKNTVRLPDADTGERQHFIFYQDEGGMRATNEINVPLGTIYYVGVIDILTPYGCAKRAENFWKGMRADRHKISPVPPEEYGNRFFDFMKAVMRGGGGGARFKPDYKPDKEKGRAMVEDDPSRPSGEGVFQEKGKEREQLPWTSSPVHAPEMSEVSHMSAPGAAAGVLVVGSEPGPGFSGHVKFGTS